MSAPSLPEDEGGDNGGDCRPGSAQRAARREPQAQACLLSFDGGVAAATSVQRPDRYRFWRPENFVDPAIPRGAGLSYAAASFLPAGRSIEHTRFDRILDFDAHRGMVDLEAGTSLAKVFDFLGPRGWYLPIQPGHGRITVGGCIASDVHGKNQARDGTFVNQVESLTLYHPDQGRIELSRSENPELFRLTCGGFGLTGHILQVRLRAQRLPGVRIEVIRQPIGALADLADALPAAAREADFVYTWHDLTNVAQQFGAGFVYRASFRDGPPADAAASEVENRANWPRIGCPPPLSAATRGRWGRALLAHPLITRAMNRGYSWREGARAVHRQASLPELLFPAHSAQTYFKLFGRAGFHEYQVIIALERFAGFVTELEERLRASPASITLCSAKLFRGTAELLRFTGDGVCLALNFPRDCAAPGLLGFLDELTLAVGGTPNLIKDSRLPRSVAERAYPGIDEFRARLAAFDPRGRFCSELAQRLAL